MNVDIKMLSERLGGFQPKLFIKDEKSTLVKAPKLYGPRIGEINPEYIYVGRLSDLPAFPGDRACVNVLCIEDTVFSEALIQKNNINLLLLNGKAELEEVFNTIQDIFISSQEMLGNAPRFLDSLVHGRGLQHIIDIGYELLKNPIVLFDTKSNLIAHSANIETDDPLNSELLKNGRLSTETINFIWATDHQKSLNNKRYPYYFKSEKLKYNRIVGNIYKDKKKVALMVVWENERPFNEKDLDLVAQLCEIISSEMQRSEFYRNMKDVLFESFMSDLLDGKTTYVEPVMKRLGSMDWKLKQNLYLMVIDISMFDSTYMEISRIRDTIEPMIKDCKAFIYNNFVVALIGRDDKSLCPKAEMNDLIRFLRDNSMVAGVSNSFKNLADIRIFFDQALKAMEIGGRVADEVIFPYEEFQIFRLLELCSAQENLTHFCHPAVFELLEYDRENNSDYAKTVYSYIASGLDSSQTAGAMHTHRNTVLYRIAKTKEQFNLDFKNGELIFHLMLSFKILGFLDRLDFEL